MLAIKAIKAKGCSLHQRRVTPILSSPTLWQIDIGSASVSKHRHQSGKYQHQTMERCAEPFQPSNRHSSVGMRNGMVCQTAPAISVVGALYCIGQYSHRSYIYPHCSLSAFDMFFLKLPPLSHLVLTVNEKSCMSRKTSIHTLSASSAPPCP